MSLPDILAAAVIFIELPLLWLMAIQLLRRTRRSPAIRVLRSGTLMAWVMALVVSLFAVVFLNNGMEHPLFDSYTTMILTRTALLALAIPALYWLLLYRG